MLEDGELTQLDLVWHEVIEKWLPLQDAESLPVVLRKGTEPAVPDSDAPALPPPLPGKVAPVSKWPRLLARIETKGLPGLQFIRIKKTYRL